MNGLPEGFVLDEPAATADLPAGFELDTEVPAGPPRPAAAEIGRQAGLAGRYLAEGAAGVVGLGADPIGITLSKISGKPYVPFAQFVSERLSAAGVPEPESSLERIIGDTSRTLAGGGAMLRGAQLAQSVPGMVGQAANVLSQSPTAQMVSAAAGGSAAGAAAEQGAGPMGQIAAGIAASLAPNAAAGLTRVALRGGASGGQALQRSIDEFAAGDASPSVGQGTGRTSMQHIESILGSVPGGAGAMSKAAERTRDQIGNAVKRMSASLDSEGSAESAGRAIEAGITKPGGFMPRFRAKSKDLYDRLDQHIAPDHPVDVSNTLGQLKRLTTPIQGAEEVSKGALLSNSVLTDTAERLAIDAASGQIPYQALKQLRTRIGERLDNVQLIDEVPKTQLRQVYAAISRDMEAAANAAGPDALQTYRRADAYYRAGVTRVDDRLRAITSLLERNGTSPEQIFKTAMSGSAEGGTRLWGLRRTIGADDWKAVQATVLNRMGRAVNSKQDDLGEAFSSETFLSNWNKLAPKAKSALFSDPRNLGMSGDLNKIAAATSKIREGSKALANPSGTAAKLSNVAGGAALLLAPLHSMEAAVAIGGGLAGSAAAAKLFTNPRFVRWLAQGTELEPGKLQAHLARLPSTLDDDDPEGNDAIYAYADGLQQAIGQQETEHE